MAILLIIFLYVLAGFIFLSICISLNLFDNFNDEEKEEVKVLSVAFWPIAFVIRIIQGIYYGLSFLVNRTKSKDKNKNPILLDNLRELAILECPKCKHKLFENNKCKWCGAELKEHEDFIETMAKINLFIEKVNEYQKKANAIKQFVIEYEQRTGYKRKER